MPLQEEYKDGGDRSSDFQSEEFVNVRNLVAGCFTSLTFQLSRLIPDSRFLLLRLIRFAAHNMNVIIK